jgi:hypothetical protein
MVPTLGMVLEIVLVQVSANQLRVAQSVVLLKVGVKALVYHPCLKAPS